MGLPSRKFLGDGRPLVTHLLVHFEENLLLLLAPFCSDNAGIEMIVVSEIEKL